ncbi:hypothetical protein [Paraburkholderia fungorum]|uniref:Ribonucleoside-diphosphate reductase alpha chain n=1 Tax=Paraburkholderia fungorum TaxID=134537 RepID=A0AAW3V2K9_9BURK|nr:hypothetical protein [Paraburkholderia fungorum]MBB4518686.1 ribonucleoside-diphosphate reductase alpha chain [Paraburkholderia fungorum]MBB6204171.1 ribonucleoside-diphosphate reductase alpha chain [Paraburkholderia fungorum]
MNVQPQVSDTQIMVQQGRGLPSIADGLPQPRGTFPALARRAFEDESATDPCLSPRLAISLAISSESSAYDVLAGVVMAGREGVPLLVDTSAPATSTDETISCDSSRGLLLHSIERLYESSQRGSLQVGTFPMVVISEDHLAEAASLGTAETYVRVGSGRHGSSAVCAQSLLAFESLGTRVSGVFFDESSVVRDGCGGIFGTSSEFVGASEAVTGVVLNLCDYLVELPGKNAQLDDRRLKEHVRLAVRDLDAMHDVHAIGGNLEQSSEARRIAIGISGIASALQKLGSAGDADKANAALGQVAGMIRDEAYDTSCDLAQEHGPSTWFDCGDFDAGPMSDLLSPEVVQRVRMFGLRNVQIFGWALVADQPVSAHAVGLTSDGSIDAVRTAEGVGQQLQWHTAITEAFGTKYLAEVLVPDNWGAAEVGKLAARCRQGGFWGVAVR